MSYILDALRKSEQQRQRGEGTSLHTPQLSAHAEKPSSLIFYGFLATLLIGAGIMIGWLHPWQQGDVAIVTEPGMPVARVSKPPQQAPLPESEMVIKPVQPAPERKLTAIALPVESVEKPVKQTAPAPIKDEGAQTQKPQSTPVSKNLPKIASTPAVNASVAPPAERSVSPGAEQAVESSTNESAQDQRILAMSELPPSIQQEIPKMSISGYAYSSVPKERTVGINDRLLQEGEYLAQGLRLEHISPDGLVFSYKKYLFRQSLP